MPTMRLAFEETPEMGVAAVAAVVAQHEHMARRDDTRLAQRGPAIIGGVLDVGLGEEAAVDVDALVGAHLHLLAGHGNDALDIVVLLARNRWMEDHDVAALRPAEQPDLAAGDAAAEHSGLDPQVGHPVNKEPLVVAQGGLHALPQHDAVLDRHLDEEENDDAEQHRLQQLLRDRLGVRVKPWMANSPGSAGST